jgi:hypothetical protein
MSSNFELHDLKAFHWVDFRDDNVFSCGGATNRTPVPVGRRQQVDVWKMTQKETDSGTQVAVIEIIGCNSFNKKRCELTGGLCIIRGVVSAEEYLSRMTQLEGMTREKATQAPPQR